jgi:hypothetical protein
MPQDEFEPTMAVFERGKTVHTLDRAHCGRFMVCSVDAKYTIRVVIYIFLLLKCLRLFPLLCLFCEARKQL